VKFMLDALFQLARPALFLMSPEDAHEATLKALERGVYVRDTTPEDSRLAVTVGGLRFPNPVGIAAGFDKDGRVADACLGLGCGFAEIGTVTPKAQDGNPRPRVFRLPQDHALINRLGFNNGGHAAALAWRQARPPSARASVVGVNIGANKDTDDRAADYVLGLKAFYDVASYFTVNISSPNTPGLRDLQAPAALDALLGRVMAARADAAAAGGRTVPIVVKIAPDIAEDDLAPIVGRLTHHAVDAIAVSNTTLARSGLTPSRDMTEAGGLSGRPLFHRSTVTLARVYRLTGGRIPLIGIGGIDSEAAALAKIEAGASLLQLYTGLIYEGPGLIGRIKRHLDAAVQRAGAENIGALTGRDAAVWAAKSPDA
jgi:dihydroorotate dehydrogenase